MNAPLVALDTETTGLHAGRQAWDIAMIRRDDSGEQVCQFFVDVDLANADPFSLAVGRFYERHPHGQRLSGSEVDIDDEGLSLAPKSAAWAVAKWTHGAHIIGSNPYFDLETLAALLRAHGLTPGWQYHAGDVACMAGGPPPWKLSRVAEQYGVKPPPEDEQHTALGDARWALDVYDAIVGGQS